MVSRAPPKVQMGGDIWGRGGENADIGCSKDYEYQSAAYNGPVVWLHLLEMEDHRRLTCQYSNSLSKIETNLGKRREKCHSELLSKAAEHRSTLDSIEERITKIGNGIQLAKSSDEKIEALSSEIEETKAAVMSFRGVGQQILSFVSAFPLEMRDLLQNILRSNWQIYHVLLNLQQSLAQSPTQSLDSNIHFEDAMGELIQLPYAYFRHWEVLNFPSRYLSYSLTLRRNMNRLSTVFYALMSKEQSAKSR